MDKIKFRKAVDYVSVNMEYNPKYYHNFKHVSSVVQRLGGPGCSAELKLAALFHDVVYDDQPDKELRSAQAAKTWLTANWPEVDANRVYELIMATETHKIKNYLDDDEAISLIKADLYTLTEPLLTISNFAKINMESQTLYGIDQYDAAAASRTFMMTFKKTMLENYALTGDEFWFKAVQGCETTTMLANDVIRRK